MSIRNACFTSFCFQKKEFEDNLKTKKYEHMMYCVFQEEICPKTKTEHTQGYIEFKTPVTIRLIKDLFGDNSTHIEKRLGTREQARKYCQKNESRKPDTTFSEYGNWEWQKQGERNDLNKVTEMIKEGKELKEIVETCPNTYIRNYKGIERMMQILGKPLVKEKIEEKKIHIHWGDSSTGKSAVIYNKYPIEQIYRKPPGKWWERYLGQKYVLIDDIQPNSYDLEEFLQWLDKYPISVPIKGSSVMLEATDIYITSNHPPETWFNFKTEQSKIALFRRFSHITKHTFDESYSDPIIIPKIIQEEIENPFIWDIEKETNQNTQQKNVAAK